MSDIKLEPYIYFHGEAKQALEFYKNIFGGEVTTQSYADVKAPVPEGASEDWLIHGKLEGDVVIMVSDTELASPEAKKVELSLGGTDDAALRKIFDGLSEGGNVRAPLKKEFWGDIFGSLTDKYGVVWMVNITQENEGGGS